MTWPLDSTRPSYHTAPGLYCGVGGNGHHGSTATDGLRDRGQLRAGDCLAGPNLGLNTSNPWPYLFDTTPCTGPHLAEVFFSGNAWAQSMAYPGDSAVYSQADASCSAAFSTYDGKDSSESAFTFGWISPTPRWDWASGDRQLVCLAYPWSGSVVDYSIKGSDR